MTARTYLCLLALVSGSAALVGCAAESQEKGAEVGAPEGGKADSFFEPTQHGIVPWGEEQPIYIGDGAEFHAFDFDLSGPADVVIETTDLFGYEPDTVVYLYQNRGDSWGQYIAKDDDGGESRLSRIEMSLTEATRYRVIVKMHDYEQSGDVGVTVSCAGKGCTVPEPVDDLEAAFNEAAEGAVYISEGDSAPEFIRIPVPDAAVPLDVGAVRELLGDRILSLFNSNVRAEVTWDDLAIEARPDFDVLADLASYSEYEDEYYREAGEAWIRVKELLDANLTDRQTFLVGPGDENGLYEDYGLYFYIVLGRAADGDFAGFAVGVVWT